MAIQHHNTGGLTNATWKRYFYAGGARIAVSETNLTGSTLKHLFSDQLGSKSLVTVAGFTPTGRR